MKCPIAGFVKEEIVESAALLQNRILLLSEPVSAETANRLIAELLLLDAADHSSRIDLYINSPGGTVSDGLAIIDAMRCLQAPVSTVCIGQAASMAAWILAAGARGQRYATPNAEVMIHQVAAGFSGPAAHIKVMAERTMRLQQRLIELLAEFTGQPAARIEEDLERDCFLTSEQALAYGLVDTVLEPYPRDAK